MNLNDVGTITKHNLIQSLFERHATIVIPEQQLMMAVLCSVVSDLVQGDRRNYADHLKVKRLRREAAEFFIKRRHVIFCDWLSLDPDWVERVIRDHVGLPE